MPQIDYLNMCAIPALEVFVVDDGDTAEAVRAAVNDQFEADRMLLRALRHPPTSIHAAKMAAHRAGMMHQVWTNPVSGKSVLVFARKPAPGSQWGMKEVLTHENIIPLLERHT